MHNGLPSGKTDDHKGKLTVDRTRDYVAKSTSNVEIKQFT